MLQRVLVGIDGSDGSRGAVEWCAQLLTGTPTEVVAIACHVHRPSLGQSTNQELRAELDPHLEEACKILGAAGVACRTLVIDGEPRLALLQVAEQEDAGMIVVGTRGRTQLTDLVLGSVASYLIHKSERAVTVVR